MTAYYNEIDGHAAQWLRSLIAAGHIAPGEVDERSIEDVHPSDLDGFIQCHFFAGIAVWSHALRSAGWPDSRPVWTGSCPCQPFSAAGKGAGFADERHLWPAFNHLISQCKPDIVFGEQVASKDGLAWLDLVHTDMEAQGYTFGAVDTCAAGFGSPQIRQRLYWVGHANSARLEGWKRVQQRADQCAAGENGMAGWMADTQQHDSGRKTKPANHAAPQADRPADWTGGRGGVFDRPGPTNGFWRDADWLGCRDGRWRPVEPGTFPLAHGLTNRVGRLRAYGNGLCAEAAKGFIEAAMDWSAT